MIIIKQILIMQSLFMIKALIEYTNLTGITFNMTDETDTLINETETSKEKGLFSKFFGGKKNNN